MHCGHAPQRQKLAISNVMQEYGVQHRESLGEHWERCDTELARRPPSARRSRRRVCLRRARRQSLRRTSRRRTGARPLAAKRSSKPRRRARDHRPASRRVLAGGFAVTANPSPSNGSKLRAGLRRLPKAPTTISPAAATVPGRSGKGRRQGIQAEQWNVIFKKKKKKKKKKKNKKKKKKD